MAEEFFTMPDVGTEKTSEVGDRVKRSAASMSAMVNDLLEYARTQLGSGIPVERHDADVQGVCQSAIDEVKVAHPDCELEMNTSGNLVVSFDTARLRQALINLLSNAIHYRAKEYPVKVLAAEEKDTVIIQVQNQGLVIPADSLGRFSVPWFNWQETDNRKGGLPRAWA